MRGGGDSVSAEQTVCGKTQRQERVWQELKGGLFGKAWETVGTDSQQRPLDGPLPVTCLHDPTPSGPADLPNLILSQFLLKRVKLVWDGEV